jgi:hypothetical protein
MSEKRQGVYAGHQIKPDRRVKRKRFVFLLTFDEDEKWLEGAFVDQFLHLRGLDVFEA